jgi:hypothetical protein
MVSSVHQASQRRVCSLKRSSSSTATRSGGAGGASCDMPVPEK